MAAIIANDSSACANGHVAYRGCRCGIVPKGFYRETVKSQTQSETKKTCCTTSKKRRCASRGCDKLSRLGSLRQMMSKHETRSNRVEDKEHASAVTKMCCIPREAVARQRHGETHAGSLRLLSRGLENKLK